MSKETDGRQQDPPPSTAWRPELADCLLLIIILMAVLFAWDKFGTLGERSLVILAALLSFTSVVTNMAIIFKIYHTDAKTRPWITKLEGMASEMAWAIKAWRQYGEPFIELIKGLGIFPKFYEKISGRKADIDMRNYVRSRVVVKKKRVRKKHVKKRRPKKKVRKDQCEVWKRPDLEVSSLVRPHRKFE